MLKSRDFRWYPKKKMMSEVQCPFLQNAHERHEHITGFWYTAISSKVVPEQSGKVESSYIYENPVCS